MARKREEQNQIFFFTRKACVLGLVLSGMFDAVSAVCKSIANLLNHYECTLFLFFFKLRIDKHTFLRYLVFVTRVQE